MLYWFERWESDHGFGQW